VRLVRNDAWEEGIASSIRAGIAAAEGAESPCDGALLSLVDQPRADAALLRALRARFDEAGAERIAACAYAGAAGVPALFPRARFGDLAALRGDSGARSLLAAHASDVLTVPFAGGELDLDTPGDLARIADSSPHAPGRVTSAGRRYVAQRLGLLLVFGCILFASAGRWDWSRGWAFLAAVLFAEACTLALLAARAPETLNQRGSRHPGVESFDKAFIILWTALSLATPAVAGLDVVRLGASSLPWSLFYVGLAVLLPASALGAWAMLENEHFEQFVRIQRERGHRVVTTGPYRLVRHPGYLGAILGALVTPLMLGSAWTFVPAVLVALLFAVRTHLEDATLRRELEGYEAYARRTRFRLVPFVW
jgi:protein-S-isoprenylcysteine O-methyltransferase Ste14